MATSELVRAVRDWVRQTDAGLAQGAARNAAAGVADRHARRLEEARTLRDLHRLQPGKVEAGGVPSLS